MSPNDNSEVSVATLVELCDEPEAARIIAERLRVKEMGPADHIRAKHEIKVFVQSRNASEATALINRALARRESNRSAAASAT